MEEDYDDVAIEEEIELELSKISISSSEIDDCGTDLSEVSSDSEPIQEELPESVLKYLNFVRSRSENAGRLILQDLENVEMPNDIYHVVPNSAAECLTELASQYNEDPEELKKRVLSEIENEEQQMSDASDNTIELKNSQDISSNKIVNDCSLTDSYGKVISFSFQEAEERCKQEYDLWLEKQKVLEHERINQLKAMKDIENSQNEEENRKRQLRQEELEAERLKLEMLHVQQQAIMEEELLKEEQAWKEQLREHEELINNLQLKIEEEKRVFEEEKARERQQLMEQQNNAAVKIQAKFKAYVVYKKCAPVLKKKRAEREKNREMKEIMERQMKEKQEGWKMKALEKKEEEEKGRTRQEKVKEENEEKMKRQEEYEKKKEIVRLQRELMFEELKNEEKNKLKFVMKEIESQNIANNTEQGKEERETEKGVENIIKKMQRGGELENAANSIESGNKGETFENMTEQKEASKIQREKESQDINKTLERNEEEADEKIKEDECEKKKLIAEKENIKQMQDIKYKKENDHEVEEPLHEELCYNIARSKDVKLKLGREEHINKINNDSLENDVKECLVTAEFQKNGNTNVLGIETSTVVNQENSIHCSYIQVDSGNTGKIDNSYASENSKLELALKEIHEETTKSENLDNFSEQPLVSDSVESKRLAWMKTCKSWTRIFEEHQKKKMVQRSKSRKCSASQLPPLSATVIIQAGPWNSLQQVTTVIFQDLPGCSLSTLSQCSRLRFLSLKRCGLLALEGLSSCKDLQFIDVEENNIQVINCENLVNLCILILNKNNISSLHGLYCCNNLMNLELSYNKITRIGGMETLKKLQRLVVDHNQLISTKGLSDNPTLLYIDCSFNHLTHIEGIENCGLLQILKLQGNNLNEFPNLENHVLLRELYLEDNNISTLGKFSTYWLPLLQILDLSQNSLTQLVPLCSYVSLEKVNISNNCLIDLKSVIQCLEGCHNLRELSLLGNPLLQEDTWRCSLLKHLPFLKILNDENISGDTGILYERSKIILKSGNFIAFCQAQIQEIVLVCKKATTRIIEKLSEDAVQRQCWYLKKLMNLSIVLRNAHECGVLNITKAEEPEQQANHLNQEAIKLTKKNKVFISGVKENKQGSLNMPERWIASGHAHAEPINSFMMVPGLEKNQVYLQKKNIQYSANANGESNAFISPKRNKFNKQITTSEGGNDLQHFDNAQNFAATIIQSHWRGYQIRKETSFYTKLNLAAIVIQSSWRSYRVRRKTVNCVQKNNHFMDRHKAATILQALWKGFHLRKKLASALAAVKAEEIEDDFREVNMDDFVFNEAVIEKEWPALDSTRFLSQTLQFSEQLPSPKCHESARCGDSSLQLERLPNKIWHIKERPKLSENNQDSNMSEKSTPLQLSDLKSPQKSSLRSEKEEQENSTPLWISDLESPQKSSLRSEKEEQISEEWGFKHISTAQLMLKRAHKMKAKKSSTKKVDPAVRLALFKNNENKHPPVKPPKKAQTAKIGYFEGKEEEVCHIDFLEEKIQKSKERTSQWLNTQVWDYEETSPRSEKCKRFLPEIDPEILKGGRVQLVTSPVRREDMDLELVSMTSASTLTQKREKNNQSYRYFTESSKKDAPAPERSQLNPTFKERISFRDHPVQFSGGWGSGKKKAKPVK